MRNLLRTYPYCKSNSMTKDPFSIIDLIAQKESEIMAAQRATQQPIYVPRQISDFPAVEQLPNQDSVEMILDEDEEFIEVPDFFRSHDKKEKKKKEMKKKKKSLDKKSLKVNKTWKQELNTSPRILMGPGPSDVHPRVLKAMATPLVGHLDPQFLTVMDDIKYMVQRTFRTSNHLSFVVSAPGSAGMETCLVNLLEPGDEAVICINGVFGGRMADIAERCGAKVIKVQAPWGEPINPYDLKKALKKSKPKIVAVVHAETSTGVLQPLEEISRLTRKAGALLVVDAVTSYCGVPLEVDKWGIDAVYTGTQKCLSAPPGLSPVSFSSRAVEVLENRRTKVQSWFLDLNLVKNYWAGAKRAYHHTGPVSAMFALREAYRLVLEEGLENRFDRHRKNHLLLRKGLEELGFQYLVEEPYRLPQLNAVLLPKSIKDEAKLRKQLLTEYNIEVGGGLGGFAGKIWRIGLMGESCTENHVNMLLGALRNILVKR